MELFRLDNSLQFLVLFLIRLPVCEFVTIGTMFFNEFAKILVFTTGRSYPLKNVILLQVIIKKVYYILVFILEKMYLCKRQVNNSYFRFFSAWLNRLRNKLLANYLRNRSNYLELYKYQRFALLFCQITLSFANITSFSENTNYRSNFIKSAYELWCANVRSPQRVPPPGACSLLDVCKLDSRLII